MQKAILSEVTENGGRRVLGFDPDPTPWRVLCASHARAPWINGEAKHEVEELEGEWYCLDCAKLTPLAESDLRKALRDPKFSHTTVRGHYRDHGCIYHRDHESPTGVYLAGSFDPFNEKAMSIVREITGRGAAIGPQRGAYAGMGGA